MNTVKTIKKIGKGLGIGFLGMLMLGCIISDSEKTGMIEQLEQEVQELEQEIADLESENKGLESQKSALNNEIDRLKEPQQEEPKEEPKEEEVQEVQKVEEPKEEPQAEEPKSDNYWIEKFDIQVVDEVVEYGIQTVTISLVADKNYSYLDINIPLYDNEGYKIGDLWGNASDVKEGQKVKIDCVSFESGNYKLEELDVDSF